MSFGKRNASPAQPELIRKYGYGAVAELHEHLTSSLRNSPRRPMSQLHRTKQQIKYLELQQARYALKQRHTQAEHIMRCVDREKQHIFKEFSATKARDLQQLVQQIQQIEQQMQVEHIRELQQEVARQDSKRSGFLGGKSQHILELQHQLKALCQKELYEEAERVDKMIEREMIQLNNKKYYEWKEQKEKKIHLLRKNQQKQKQALRKRLQNLLDEQIKARNQQYEKLNKRYLVHRKKICYNLLKQPKSHKKITSESDRKNIGIESQFILEETEQKQIKTGLSTQVQTYRAVDLHTPQKNKASFE